MVCVGVWVGVGGASSQEPELKIDIQTSLCSVDSDTHSNCDPWVSKRQELQEGFKGLHSLKKKSLKISRKNHIDSVVKLMSKISHAVLIFFVHSIITA